MQDKQLQAIRIVQVDDPDADLSYLGVFSQTPGPDAIDLSLRSDWSPKYLRYFNPANPWTPEGWAHVTAEQIETSLADLPDEWRTRLPEFTCKAHLLNAFQNEQDCQRAIDYGKGWTSIGIRAEAKLIVCGVVQNISSGGLWGIESDSSNEYLNEVGREEVAALRDILHALGFAETDYDIKFAET